MPDIKFSQLTVTTSVESSDLIPIIDRSNPLMSENGSNATISIGDLSSSLFDGLGDGALSSTKIQENPTFFGNVTLPATTNIGGVSGTELSFLSGLRSNIQTQLDNPTFNGTLTIGPGTISTPPLKINPGTNVVTLTAGALEFDGTKLYITDSAPAREALATESYVESAISAVVDDAPTLLNTLNELSAALNDDANYASTVTTALSGKEPSIVPGTNDQYWRGDKTWATLNASSVGLSNVTNESKATMFTSPSFTGTPLSTTAAADTNTTQIATTAYVLGQAASTTPLINGAAAVGSSLRYARADHVHPTDTTRAPLESPSFTGTPLSTTAVVNTNTTQIATTAFVIGQASSANPVANGLATPGISARYSRADHVHPTDTTRAPLESPSFTGTPLAPTAAAGTNTTQVATTAYVQGEFASSYNNILEVSDASLTVSSTHYNKYIRLSNSGGVTINLPTISGIPTGTTITFRRTTSAGAITLSAGSGVTINDNDAASVLAGDVFAIKHITNNTWDFI